jgi:hypothetical protein
MAQRVLPVQYSLRIFRGSFLAIGSVVSAWYNELPGCMACSCLVLATSLNYWRYPIFGVRRSADMLACACSLTYQLNLAANTAAPTPRNAYFATVMSGVGCYGASRYFNFVRRNPDVSSWFHCLLHACGNVGNVILYDSLGTNRVGWQGPPPTA